MSRTVPYSQEELRPGATACVNSFAEIRNDDRVLILSDNVNIAEALVHAIREGEQSKCATADIVYLTRVGRPARGMSRILASARDAATVVFNVLSEYDTQHEFFAKEHTFRRQLVSVDPESELRIFHMLGVDEFAFTQKGLLAQSSTEIDEMENLTHRLAVALTLARTVKINSAADAELIIDAGGPENVALVSSGRLRSGTWGNLPSGEAFLLPVTAKGSVVIDKAVAGISAGFDPFRLNVSDARASLGDNAPAQLEEILERDEREARAAGEAPENVRRVCEFGIGTNPRARVAGSFIEIEKILGTIHIAIGGNIAFGGNVHAPGHTDMVVGGPEVVLDDDYIILANGELRQQVLTDFVRPTASTVPLDRLGEKIIVDRKVDTVLDRNGKLLRQWTDPRKNELIACIGEDDTARAAKKLWDCFGDHESREVGQLVASFQGSSPEEVLKLVTVLKRFGTIGLRGPGGKPSQGI